MSVTNHKGGSLLAGKVTPSGGEILIYSGYRGGCALTKQMLDQPTALRLAPLESLSQITGLQLLKQPTLLLGGHPYRPSAIDTANAASSVVTNIKCGSKLLSHQCFDSEERQPPVREDYYHRRDSYLFWVPEGGGH